MEHGVDSRFRGNDGGGGDQHGQHHDCPLMASSIVRTLLLMKRSVAS
jgi:hypothetical protein